MDQPTKITLFCTPQGYLEAGAKLMQQQLDEGKKLVETWPTEATRWQRIKCSLLHWWWHKQPIAWYGNGCEELLRRCDRCGRKWVKRRDS